LITAKGLNKKFNKRLVLDNVSLDISKGERLVIVGHNGSGKTTLIRCILGLYNFSGLLTVDGTNPRKDRTEILKRVGYVPQLPPPIDMSVIDLARYSADVSGMPVGPIIEMSKRLTFDVDGNVRKNFLKLSGGMKQKLLIAIALGRERDLIIMDEPASNLDPGSRDIFYDMLTLYSGDATVMLTSHRADELTHIVNRVIEMDYGRVVSDKTTPAGEEA